MRRHQVSGGGDGRVANQRSHSDAAGNAWVTNQNGNSVVALNSSGGLVGSYAPSGSNFNSPHGIAIDGSSNVWVMNGGNNSVTEIVGAATPVVTPMIANLRSPYTHPASRP